MGWTAADLARLKRGGVRVAPVVQIPGLDPDKRKRSKIGKRADLGGMFVRSSWEANIARILNYLKDRGAVIEWKYESREFEFKAIPERKLRAITRGNRFYKIDFEIWFAEGIPTDYPDHIYWFLSKIVPNGTPQYVLWEVKGFMRNDDRIKLDRMASYYPEIKLVVVDGKMYQALRQQYQSIVPNWEEGRAAVQFRTAS